MPSTVDALARAAVMKHDYLAYNDSHAFARKCTWALGDIGTPEARAHLEKLAGADDPEIGAYARKRLDRWDDELSRKVSASVRVREKKIYAKPCQGFETGDDRR